MGALSPSACRGFSKNSVSLCLSDSCASNLAFTCPTTDLLPADSSVLHITSPSNSTRNSGVYRIVTCESMSSMSSTSRCTFEPIASSLSFFHRGSLSMSRTCALALPATANIILFFMSGRLPSIPANSADFWRKTRFASSGHLRRCPRVETKDSISSLVRR